MYRIYTTDDGCWFAVDTVSGSVTACEDGRIGADYPRAELADQIMAWRIAGAVITRTLCSELPTATDVRGTTMATRTSRPMMPCSTCGTSIRVPLLPNDRPRCFPCIDAEIRAASADADAYRCRAAYRRYLAGFGRAEFAPAD